MHCPQCHHENEKEARFCEHCGAPLPLQTKKKRPPSLLWGGLVVGVVALLAAGWFLISQHQPSDKPTGNIGNSPTVFDVARLRKCQSQLS